MREENSKVFKDTTTFFFHIKSSMQKVLFEIQISICISNKQTQKNRILEVNDISFRW